MLVLDASAAVDLLSPAVTQDAIAARMAADSVVAPAHFDAEVLSAFGRMARAGSFPEARVPDVLNALASLTIQRYDLAALMVGAWGRRSSLRLVDALYVELAAQLHTVVLTTDARLARATPLAELVGPPTLEP